MPSSIGPALGATIDRSAAAELSSPARSALRRRARRSSTAERSPDSSLLRSCPRETPAGSSVSSATSCLRVRKTSAAAVPSSSAASSDTGSRRYLAPAIANARIALACAVPVARASTASRGCK
eukprot:6205492-Pleurochrysis_carterae.AAC.1